MDDPAYVGMVVIVLNATLNSPTIVPILPLHTRRHYPYLRHKYPELLPEIPLDATPLHACSLRGENDGGMSYFTHICRLSIMVSQIS